MFLTRTFGSRAPNSPEELCRPLQHWLPCPRKLLLGFYLLTTVPFFAGAHEEKFLNHFFTVLISQ